MEGEASLSIASFGPATLSDSKVRATNWATRETNKIDDIDGSRPVNKHEKFANKYATYVQEDPSGIRSKPAIHSRNTRDMTLYVDDIEGTRCRVKDHMALTQRRVNPLNPDYQLSKFVQAEHVIPRFIRDELFVDDVEGSRSKPLYKHTMRDILGVNDIEGARPSWKPRHERCRTENPPRELLVTDDVSRKTHRLVDRTQRHTNMLDPAYTIHGTEVSDEAKYTKPKPSKQFIPENHLLQTTDIPGATAGWRESMVQRKEIRNINNTLDIEGAQADTFKHTITTKRETHPLQPVYQDLDSGAPLQPIVAPLLPATLITRPSVRFPATSTAGTQQQQQQQQRPQSGSILGQSQQHGAHFGGASQTSARERPRSGNDLFGKGYSGNNNQMSLFSAPVNPNPVPAINFNIFQQQPPQHSQQNTALNFDMFQMPGESKSFASKFDEFTMPDSKPPAVNNFLNFGAASDTSTRHPAVSGLNLNFNQIGASPRGLGSARSMSANPRVAASASPRNSGRLVVSPGGMLSGKFGSNQAHNQYHQGGGVGIAERRAAIERQADIDAVRFL